MFLLHDIGVVLVLILFFFKQKTAYEMRISDWSSDVCSSDLARDIPVVDDEGPVEPGLSLVEHRAPDDAGHPGAERPPALEQAHVGADAHVVEKQRRSEERHVGKECVSTCRSRWSPYQ